MLKQHNLFTTQILLRLKMMGHIPHHWTSAASCAPWCLNSSEPDMAVGIVTSTSLQWHLKAVNTVAQLTEWLTHNLMSSSKLTQSSGFGGKGWSRWYCRKKTILGMYFTFAYWHFTAFQQLEIYPSVHLSKCHNGMSNKSTFRWELTLFAIALWVHHWLEAIHE